MAVRYEIKAEQKAEIEAACKKNKNKRTEARLKVLSMRAEVKSLKEISEVTGYHYAHVSKIVSAFVNHSLTSIIEINYPGNKRNMTYEHEAEILAPYLEKAEKGQLVSVAEIAESYQKAVEHPASPTQIYRVLRRHNWRKVMPRSRHPKKASEEAINALKKLTNESRN